MENCVNYVQARSPQRNEDGNPSVTNKFNRQLPKFK